MSAVRDWTQASAKTLVEYEVKEGVAWIRLSAPPANTYTHAMMRQLDDAILRARFDNGVHVLVITGAGEKFFCAGANIQMLQEVDPTFKYQFCLHANETLTRLEQTPKLVIAAIASAAGWRSPWRPICASREKAMPRSDSRKSTSGCSRALEERSAWQERSDAPKPSSSWSKERT